MASFYEGYSKRRDANEQVGMRDLAQASSLMQLQQAVMAQREQQEAKSIMQQGNGNLEAVMQGALKAGRPDIAAKLAPLIEAQRKAAAPTVLTPGSQVMKDGKVSHTVPFAPQRPEAPPEIIRLQEHLKSLPEGDANRAPILSRIKMLSERAPTAGSTPSGPVATGFTPDALELRARQYLSGDAKAFTNLGRGAQGRETIVAITNRAAAILREQGGSPQEIGRRIAEFRANANSLSKMTQSYDAITAFEQTAVRNGKILKDLADNVDATGVPVIERWIRAGRKEVAGDTDVAKFQAQLQVYRTEAARILTNPNLSGQLTDSARKEVEEFLKGSSSAQQIRGVVDLLERDFDNRKKTLEQQMRDIRTRLERNSSAGEPAPAPAPADAPKKRIRFDAQGNEIK